MNLVVDLGNSKAKYAVINDKGKTEFYLRNPKRFVTISCAKLTKKYKFKNAILSASSKVPDTLIKFMTGIPNFINLDGQTPIPIKINYSSPDSLGKDRLAASVGAYKAFPGQNSIIVDMGTCITIDLMTAEGVFMGGNISPGIRMRLAAMQHYTARLPKVDPEDTGMLLGNSTKTALQNGGVLGALMEIERTIDLVTAKYSELNVILTGGDAEYFESWSKYKIFASPNLVIEGLNEILKYNVK